MDSYSPAYGTGCDPDAQAETAASTYPAACDPAHCKCAEVGYTAPQGDPPRHVLAYYGNPRRPAARCYSDSSGDHVVHLPGCNCRRAEDGDDWRDG